MHTAPGSPITEPSPVSDTQTLLSNTDGTIEAHGPLVLVCECQGAALDLGIRVVSTFALVVASIIGLLALVRVVPWPIALIAATWITLAGAARFIARQRRRMHGRFHIDLERGEIAQQGRGFARRWPTSAIIAAALPLVTGPEAEEGGEPGMEPRWLELHLEDGVRLRLGKAPAYALRPAVAFFRKAGLPVRV